MISMEYPGGISCGILVNLRLLNVIVLEHHARFAAPDST
jgi:hypothetical protein